MITAAFERQKWPKRHEHLVEECVVAGRVLHVNDVLSYLSGWHRQFIRSWNPPTHPWLTVVPRMAGPLRRWWFLCPRCTNRCETLYVTPSAHQDDWRCRWCWNLIYASQRHGFRHPLRRVSTPRKKITQRKEVRQLMARHRLTPIDDADAMVNDESRWIEDMERIKEYLARRRTEASAVRTRLANEAEKSLAVVRELAETADSARVRKGAQRALARYQRMSHETNKPEESLRTAAPGQSPTFAAVDIERRTRVAAEINRSNLP
jgi:hypothetical protein